MYSVLVPGRAHRLVRAPTWEDGPTPGRSIPLSDFFVATPGDSVTTINSQLARGKHLLLTPGVYDVDRSPSTSSAPTPWCSASGIATLTAVNGAVPVRVADVKGVVVAGIMIDAGPVNSPLLMQVGTRHGRGRAARPRRRTRRPCSDVFFRVGGPHVGKATVSLEVNSDDVLLDHIWAWRADHGDPGAFGWTSAPPTTASSSTGTT